MWNSNLTGSVFHLAMLTVDLFSSPLLYTFQRKTFLKPQGEIKEYRHVSSHAATYDDEFILNRGARMVSVCWLKVGWIELFSVCFSQGITLWWTFIAFSTDEMSCEAGYSILQHQIPSTWVIEQTKDLFSEIVLLNWENVNLGNKAFSSQC